MTTLQLLEKYFPGLDNDIVRKLDSLHELYTEWNARINVISRKDIANFPLHHLLHSLSIARFISFEPGTTILDAGTGGGLPGLPLAIMFPESEFVLADSIKKKIRVVQSITNKLGITNVNPVAERVEKLDQRFDFVISRAVTSFAQFVGLTSNLLKVSGKSGNPGGIIYLKGGSLVSELGTYREKCIIKEIPEYFTEPFFSEKKIVFLPASEV